MMFVEKCVLEPHACAVFPTLGSAHRKGYYDTGMDLPGPGIHTHRVYVSVEAVEQLAITQGWTSPDELQKLVGENERLEAENQELQEQFDVADAIVDSIDALESAGLRARKKSGRPKAAA